MALSSLFSFFDRCKPAQPSPDDEAAQKDRSEDPKPMPALAMEPADPPPAPSPAAASGSAPPRILEDALSIYGVGRAPEVEKTQNYTPDSPLLHPQTPEPLGEPQTPPPSEDQKAPAAGDASPHCPAAPAQAAGAPEAEPLQDPRGSAAEDRQPPAAEPEKAAPPAPVVEAIPFGDLASEEAFAAEHPESAPKRRRRRPAKPKTEAAPSSPQHGAPADDALAPKAPKKRRARTAKTAGQSPAAGAQKKSRRRRKPAPLDDALKTEALAAFQKGGAVETVARTLQLPRSVVSAWMDEYLAGTLLSKKEKHPEGAPEQDALF